MSLWSKGVGVVKFNTPVEGNASLLIDIIGRKVPLGYLRRLEVTPTFTDVYKDLKDKYKANLSAGIAPGYRISGFSFTYTERDGSDCAAILEAIGGLFEGLEGTYNEEYKVSIATFTVDACGEVGTVALAGDEPITYNYISLPNV